jgi:MFS transporter, YNFM family, putative membrane transport protein
MIQSHTRPWWRMTLALCLGSFMVFSNLYVTQPLLPMLAREFNVSPLLASYSFTISTAALGLSLLVYGPLSDAIGRRRLMLASMLGVALSTIALSQVEDYSHLLLWRALQGFCLGGLPAMALAYMADEFEPSALLSAVGLYIAANSLGGIGGRLMGGFAGEYLGWSQAFLVVGGLGALLWLLVAWLLPAPQGFVARPLDPRSMLRDLGQHLFNRRLLLAYLIGGLHFMIFVNQYSFITFVLEADPWNLSTSWLGMLFLTYLTGTLGSGMSGKLTRRFGQPQCMIAGSVLLMLGTLTTLSPWLPTIILGFFINSFGFFLAHSSASSWVSANARQAKASASSLYLVFYYTGASVGGLYLNPFWQWQHWGGVVIGSLLILILTTFLGQQLRILPHKERSFAEKTGINDPSGTTASCKAAPCIR